MTCSPEQFVASIDFRYLTDALDRDEALDLLRGAVPHPKPIGLPSSNATDIPAYLTSAGGSATTK